MGRQILLVLLVAGITVGCASKSREIAAAYVSPMQYEHFTCEQLVEENGRVQQKVSIVAGSVDDRASGDAVKMGVGLVLFWPSLFFIKGDGHEAQEYARLKGEHEAIEIVYNRKNCGRMPAVDG